MIVSTGRLRMKLWFGGYADLENSGGNSVVCFAILGKFFNIPKGTAYWLEVSNTPQHGDWVMAEVVSRPHCAVMWRPTGGRWRGLYESGERFLLRHFKLSEKPTRLWCRLVYEE